MSLRLSCEIGLIVLDEVKKSLPVPSSNIVVSPQTRFRFSELFLETSEQHFKNSLVTERFDSFLDTKKINAMTPFGSNDKPLGVGPMAGILHANLTHDIRIFYTVRDRNPHTVYLYFVATHDESGTVGGGRRSNIQKNWAKRIQNINKNEFGITETNN